MMSLVDVTTLVDKLLNPWVLFGFAAQGAFFMRFVIQWVASERRGRSYVPVVFWYFSLAGGMMLFTYAVQAGDPVFILGQGLGCVIYVRNLILIHRRQARIRRRRRGTLEALMDDGLEDVASSAAEDNGTVPGGEPVKRPADDLAAATRP